MCCVLQKPGQPRGWSKAMEAFNSTLGYPGEGPESLTIKRKTIASFFKPAPKKSQVPFSLSLSLSLCCSLDIHVCCACVLLLCHAYVALI